MKDQILAVVSKQPVGGIEPGAIFGYRPAAGPEGEAAAWYIEMSEAQAMGMTEEEYTAKNELWSRIELAVDLAQGEGCLGADEIISRLATIVAERGGIEAYLDERIG